MAGSESAAARREPRLTAVCFTTYEISSPHRHLQVCDHCEPDQAQQPLLNRELEYLRNIVRAAHRAWIGGDRTGAVILPCEFGDAVCVDADVAEPGG